MDLGPHAVYIAAAYAVTALIVAGLIMRAVLDHRAQTRALSAFSERGVVRRSEPNDALGDPRRGLALRTRSTPAHR